MQEKVKEPGSEFQYVGHRPDRPDGVDKVTGRAKYAFEYAAQGEAAYGFIVSAAIGKGRVIGVDARDAERAPGVLLVLTQDNAPPQTPWGPVDLPDRFARAEPALDTDAVRYFGFPVAFVVAESFEQARAAAALVHLRYGSQPGEYDLRALTLGGVRAPRVEEVTELRVEQPAEKFDLYLENLRLLPPLDSLHVAERIGVARIESLLVEVADIRVDGDPHVPLIGVGDMEPEEILVVPPLLGVSVGRRSGRRFVQSGASLLRDCNRDSRRCRSWRCLWRGRRCGRPRGRARLLLQRFDLGGVLLQLPLQLLLALLEPLQALLKVGSRSPWSWGILNRRVGGGCVGGSRAEHRNRSREETGQSPLDPSTRGAQDSWP